MMATSDVPYRLDRGEGGAVAAPRAGDGRNGGRDDLGADLPPLPPDATWGRRLSRRLCKRAWYNPRGCDLGGAGGSGQGGSGATENNEGGADADRRPPPSLDAAWSHHERDVLPRLPIGGDGDASESRLYPPWSTPLPSLSIFGVSTTMFLSSLLVASLALFIAGVLNIPLMAYYWNYASGGKSGVDYYGVGRSIRASAICDATEWVECPSCHYEENRGEYPSYRLKVADDGTYLARRNACDFDHFLLPGMLSYVASLLTLAIYAFFLSKQRRAEVVIDESVQTASDYSIKISNPPRDAVNPEEWRNFFDQFVDADEDRTCEVVESVEVLENDQYGPRPGKLTRLRGGGVVAVTIAADNGQLISKLIERRQKLEVLGDLMAELSNDVQSRGVESRLPRLEMDHLTTMEAIETVVADASSHVHSRSSSWYMKFRCFLSEKLGLMAPNDPHILWQEILNIENEVRTTVNEHRMGITHSAVAVFVTFDSERSQRNALHALSTGKLDVWRNRRLHTDEDLLRPGGQINVKECARSSSMWSLSDPALSERTVRLSFPQLSANSTATSLGRCLRFRGDRVLDVSEAPEPSDVRWTDLGSTARRRVQLHLASALGMIAFVCWSGTFIYGLATTRPGMYAAGFIALTNALVPVICELISNKESHPTEHAKQLSLYVKITLFRWFNSAIALTVICTFIETISVEDGNESKQQSLMYKVYPVIVAELFCNPLIEVLDLPENFRKHVLAPRARDQMRMNACFGGARFWLAERYTDVNRVVFVALFFSSILPESLFLGSLALLAQYHVGKFSLLRLCGPAPDVGFHLARFNRNHFSPIIVATHVTMCAYWWSGYPYDQVCEDGNGGYVACSQNLWKSHTWPPLPRFQSEDARWMTESQETLASLYGWTSVLVIMIASFQFLGSTIVPWVQSLYESTYEPDGMDQGISFSKVTHLKEVHGYVPQAKVNGFLFPLLACDIDGINAELIGWKDEERGFNAHSLLCDVAAITKSKTLPNMVFSVVRQWKQ
ncbi:hypothetical protein ACHAWF_016906 [Thalassiosira exigua]